MAARRKPWINAIAAFAGGIVLGSGVVRLVQVPSLLAAVWTTLGFLVLGWAILDGRRFRRGTPESEIDGGHTIE